MEREDAGQISHTHTHSFRILRLHSKENEPCEQACTTALLFKTMPTERPIESGCILRQSKCRPLPEPPVRRSKRYGIGYSCMCNFPHDPNSSSIVPQVQLMQMEGKWIQIISALQMWRQPKSNPFQDTDTRIAFLPLHIHLHISLKPASQSKLSSNFTHMDRKFDQIFLVAQIQGLHRNCNRRHPPHSQSRHAGCAGLHLCRMEAQINAPSPGL